MSTYSAVQIGSEDSVTEVLAKTRSAQQWLGQRPDESPDVAALPRTPTILRVSAHIPEKSPAVQDVFLPAFARLEAISGGRLRVESHWDGKLHPERDGVQALRTGLTDCCPVYSAWSPDTFAAAQLLSLPFLFDSAEAATHVSEQLYDACFRSDVEACGILMGRMVSTSNYNLFSRSPIGDLATLRGQAVACSDGVESAVFEALGALPFPASTPEAVRAFAEGRVAVVSISDSAAHTTGLYRWAGFRTSLNMLRVSLEYGLSRSFFDGLALPLKLLLNDWLRALAQAGAQLFYGLAGARAREAFTQAGIKTVRLDASEESRWRDVVRPVEQDWLHRLDHLGRDGTGMLAQLRQASRRYGAWSCDELMNDTLHRPARNLLPGLPAV